MVCVLLTSLPTPVLIETYWNVKKLTNDCRNNKTISINRNILECKARMLTPDGIYASGINRNILECKDRQPIHCPQGIKSINRNILECK